MQRMPPDPRTVGFAGAHGYMPGARYPMGTLIPIETLRDFRQGSCVISRDSKSGCTAGNSYAVKQFDLTYVEVMNKKRQRHKVKSEVFVRTFDVRRGPIIEEALQPGLAVRAIMDGKSFHTGDIFTLLETAGSAFDAVSDRGGRVSLKRQEVLLGFEFV